MLLYYVIYYEKKKKKKVMQQTEKEALSWSQWDCKGIHIADVQIKIVFEITTYLSSIFHMKMWTY